MTKFRFYSSIISLITLVISLCAWYLGGSAIRQVEEVKSQWSNYNAESAESSYLLSQIHRHLGYGGFIHQFKNMVLRQDLGSVDVIEKELASALTAIDRYRQRYATETELPAVLAVEKVFKRYQEKFHLAVKLIGQGVSSMEVDRQVKVDDTEALLALEILNQSVISRSESTSMEMGNVIDRAMANFYLSAFVIPAIVVFSVIMIVLLYRLTKANRETEENHLFLNELFKSAPDAILTVNHLGGISQANGAMEQLSGYTGFELSGMQLEELLPVDMREHHKSLREGFFGDPKGRAMDGAEGLKLRHKSGDSVPVEISLSYVRLRSQVTAIAIVRDVTTREMTQRQIRKSQAQLKNAQKIARLGSWVLDVETLKMDWSPEVYDILGIDPDAVTAPVLDNYLCGSNQVERENFFEKLKPQEDNSLQYHFERKTFMNDGSMRYLQEIGEYERNSAGEVVRVIGTLQDITEQKESYLSMQQSAVVFENISDAVVMTSEDHKVIAVNRAYEDVTGYEESESLGQLPGFMCSDQHSEFFYEEMNRTLEATGHWQGEVWDRRKGGDLFPMWLRLTRAQLSDGRSYFIGVFSDITEKKTAEEKLKHMALHDPLTGLPNRASLLQHLDHSLKHSDRIQKMVAVLFIDLDHFKVINDSLGHPVGDGLLKEVSRRLVNSVRQDDLVARLSGDEFMVVVEELEEPQAAEKVAKKILESFAEPAFIDGNELHMGLSIGVSLYPRDANCVTDLVKHADVAMYRAKENGRNNFHFYSKELAELASRRLSLENDLRRGIAEDQFYLVFQPQFDVSSSALVGCEALVRWHHPERGIVSPVEFIAMAEETRLIVPLGELVLRKAIKQYSVWRQQGMTLPKISVNLAGAQVIHSDIVEVTRNVLNEYSVEPSLLEFEVTETFIMENADKAIPVLERLRDLGVNLSIDDFGTGYSSLAQLKRLPIHTLKIDRSFIKDIPEDSDDIAITQAILAMGRSLNLVVIAEGIETAAQKDFLASLGCDMAQGYFYSEPLSEDMFFSRYSLRDESILNFQI